MVLLLQLRQCVIRMEAHNSFGRTPDFDSQAIPAPSSGTKTSSRAIYAVKLVIQYHLDLSQFVPAPSFQIPKLGLWKKVVSMGQEQSPLSMPMTSDKQSDSGSHGTVSSSQCYSG
ncbi:unnamed protein product [Musa textilis]